MKQSLKTLIVCIGLFFTAGCADALGIIDCFPRPPKPALIQNIEMVSATISVSIDNDIAITSITQVFKNPNPSDMEGEFIFPLPKDSVVTDFTMLINGKPVKGEVLNKDQAKSIYEDIVRKMKDPGLIEWMDYDLFRVKIYPIVKNGNQTIQLEYSTPITRDQNLYQYSIITNVPKSAKDIASKTIPIDFNLEIKDTVPIKNLYSPTGSLDIKTLGKAAIATGKLESSNTGGNFIIFYEKESGETDISLITSQANNNEKFFALTISPPWEATTKTSQPGNYVFVIDTSGSMNDEAKIVQAKNALKYCINQLQSADKFALINFSTEVNIFKDSLTTADDGKSDALKWVDELSARGGTNISGALDKGVEYFKNLKESLDANTIIFITDGLPTVGLTNADSIEKQISDKLKGFISQPKIFAFGVGTDVNTKLLDGIASKTNGVSDYIMPKQDLEIPISRFFDKISKPAIINPQLEISGIQVKDIYPQKLPDIYYGTQLVIYGKYTSGTVANIKISGYNNTKKLELTHTVNLSNPTSRRKYVEKLWAGRKLGYLIESLKLNGESKELKSEIEELGKQYELLTPYTSFLVLEDEKSESQTIASQRSNSRSMAPEAARFSALPALASGDKAVSISRHANTLKSASTFHELSPASGELKNNILNTRIISGKQFQIINQIWTETLIKDRAIDYKITFASELWFQLKEKLPDFNEIFLSDSEIIFELPSGKIIFISPNNTENMTLKDMAIN